MITEFCFNSIPIRGLQLARMKKLSALLEKEFRPLYSTPSSPHNSLSEGAFQRLQAIAEPITSKLIKYTIIVTVWFCNYSKRTYQKH